MEYLGRDILIVICNGWNNRERMSLALTCKRLYSLFRENAEYLFVDSDTYHGKLAYSILRDRIKHLCIEVPKSGVMPSNILGMSNLESIKFIQELIDPNFSLTSIATLLCVKKVEIEVNMLDVDDLIWILQKNTIEELIIICRNIRGFITANKHGEYSSCLLPIKKIGEKYKKICIMWYVHKERVYRGEIKGEGLQVIQHVQQVEFSDEILAKCASEEIFIWP
jgi:hypothetical protein